LKSNPIDPSALAFRLRRFLPLAGHGRPRLLGLLRRERPGINGASLLYVTNIYDGGVAGLMCAIRLDRGAHSAPVLVVPISLVAFDRRHPISREISSYQRGSAKGP
jgi:hypothetical protein